MFWGLGVSILLIGIVGVFLFVFKETDHEPIILYRDILDEQNANKVGPVPPPNSSTDRYWNEGEWHDTRNLTKSIGLNKPSKQTSHEQNNSSPFISLPFGVTYAALGLEIPPKGYSYVWEKEGIPKLDENGDPILLKESEPYIEILYEKGFAPSPEQLSKYMKLKGKYYAARGWVRIAEAEQLELELKEMKTKAIGKVPGAVLISGGDSSDYSKKRREKLKDAYFKLGLSHLYDYIITGQISH